ncbi:hypothetical protein FMM05_07100 [Flavobacterium zepuense]|uniref:Uncharacterized protein n=1 Tax=Flavobacterium zepuense TaxID=2593302 RepID=A0A552V6A5_9FLAO|nr:hypothetical protein [Flavobacterium zepuense]TRW25982.1 hypothetical protein FMM05_07100 [Flavobacterium zepuense]
MRNLITIILFITLISCRHSKWEETVALGIFEEPESLDPIYFQDSLNGIIGGYKLIHNDDSKNIDKLDAYPVAYMTKNGGRNWKPIPFDANINNGTDDILLSGDTITCLIDSMLIRSYDLGLHWNVVEQSNLNDLRNKYFPNAYHHILYRDFEFGDKKYTVKESYTFKAVEVIICHGEEAMTDHYFISRNSGKDWTFLQKDAGSNKRKFLLDDLYLITYEPPYGLQKLKLK